VTRVFELAGATKDEATAKAQVVIGFETRLAQAANTRVENRDPDKTYNKRTLAQVATEFPGFDFATYLATMGVPASHQDVIVRQPKFFTEFGIVANGTSVDEWKTYLKWHALRGAAAFLPKAFDEESFAFYGKTLQGVPEREERWKRVLAATDGAVGEALGQLYVEKAFSPKSKERMKVLIENLRAALKVRVEGLPWMGDETKKKAFREARRLQREDIGYPDNGRTTKLTISRKSYFDNVIAGEQVGDRPDIAKLGKPIDRTEWQMTPPR
jgi:predicted metalloendopeptidase